MAWLAPIRLLHMMMMAPALICWTPTRHYYQVMKLRPTDTHGLSSFGKKKQQIFSYFLYQATGTVKEPLYSPTLSLYFLLLSVLFRLFLFSLSFSDGRNSSVELSCKQDEPCGEPMCARWKQREKDGCFCYLRLLPTDKRPDWANPCASSAC